MLIVFNLIAVNVNNIPINNVILSGARCSRSEQLAQSKDLYPLIYAGEPA